MWGVGYGEMTIKFLLAFTSLHFYYYLLTFNLAPKENCHGT